MKTKTIMNYELFILSDWLAWSLLILCLMVVCAFAFRLVWNLFFKCDEPDYFEAIDWSNVAQQIKEQTLYTEGKKDFEADTKDYILHFTFDWWDGKVYFGSATYTDENGITYNLSDEDKEKLHKHLEYWWFQ